MLSLGDTEVKANKTSWEQRVGDIGYSCGGEIEDGDGREEGEDGDGREEGMGMGERRERRG